jgi:hypothetical protein
MFLTLVDLAAWSVILFFVSVFLFLGGYILWNGPIARFLREATPKNWLALALCLAVWIWIVSDLAHQF